MKTTDTPETDNHEAERDAMDTRAHADYIATLELCRDMERERDEWKAKYIHLKSQLTQTQGCVTISRNGYVQDLERERDEARAESIRWMSIAEGRGRTDDEGESDCSVCGGCFMLPSDDPAGDVMNTPCPKCNGHSEDTSKGIANLIRERDEAREYADKLAEGLPDGMLPKDVEVLREANTGLAVELAAVTDQRDRLVEALREIRKGITEPTHHRRGTLEIANEALAAVKGGEQ